MIYKDAPYDEKFGNTLIFLFIAGVAGVVIGRVILDDNHKYQNSAVSKGLFIGGIMLIITSLFVNWDNMGDESRLLILGLLFGSIIWVAYNFINELEDDEEEQIIRDEDFIEDEEN